MGLQIYTIGDPIILLNDMYSVHQKEIETFGIIQRI